MPINEIITNDPSSSAVPTAALTEVLMSSYEQGQAILEVQQPSGPWIPVASGNGSFVMNTPDIALVYRFRPLQKDKAVRVYMS